MHQHPYVLSGTVAHNLSFACSARGITGKAAAEASSRALRLVGMESYATRKQQGLSGGEAQRLALARVIVSGAEVLLLDEPTASADAASRDLIVEALSLLAAQGTTIIFSTHEMDIIDRIARRVLEFERGTIIRESWR
jgi:energy-coupling factor transporter ATP-binding protein EcfA2